MIKSLFNFGYKITHTEKFTLIAKLIKTNPSHYLPWNYKLQILQEQFIFLKTLILDLNSMSDWLYLTESDSSFHTKHARNRIEFVP